MNDFIKNIIKANFDQWLGFIIISMLMAGSILIITSIIMPKEIECYYLDTSTADAYPIYRVVAYVDWSPNTTAFVSNDYTQALDVLHSLKQCGQ